MIGSGMPMSQSIILSKADRFLRCVKFRIVSPNTQDSEKFHYPQSVR